MVVYLHHDFPGCLTRFNRGVGFKSGLKCACAVYPSINFDMLSSSEAE
jgi:hypothetical protein